jgi:integrase
MDEIMNKIKDKRPNLSVNSVKTYKSILKNLYDKCYNDKDYEFSKFDDDKKVLEHLKDIPFNKRKTVLAALSVLTGNKNYNVVMMDDIHKYNSNEMKQEKTPQQEENMITHDEVKQVFQNLENNAKLSMKKAKLESSDYNTIQKYILLALCGGILQPPRRSADWNMKWKNYDEDKDNYVDVKNSKFIFQQYKTAKDYGKVEVEISKPLKVILNKWFKIAQCDYILYDNKMQPLTSPQIAHRLNEIFGKKISTSMLRHIYITHKFGNVDLQAIQETATEMGNSPLQLLKYVKH